MPEGLDDITVLQIDPVIASRLVFSAVFVLTLYFLALALRKVIQHRIEEHSARFGLMRAVNYTAMALGLIVLGIIWLERLGGFSVALGILGAGAVFAIREVIASVGGWLLITSGRAFRVDDRIEIGGIQGDVIDFGVLRTTLLEVGNWVRGDQYTGRVVTVANSAVFDQPLYNYTRYFNFIWDEVHVPIAYHTNWEKARDICWRLAEEQSQPILLQARSEMEEMSRRYLVSHAELSPSVFTSFNDNWVELAVRYLTPVRGRRRMRDELSRAILMALQKAGDITIASQTLQLSGTLGVEQGLDGK